MRLGNGKLWDTGLVAHGVSLLGLERHLVLNILLPAILSGLVGLLLWYLTERAARNTAGTSSPVAIWLRSGFGFLVGLKMSARSATLAGGLSPTALYFMPFLIVSAAFDTATNLVPDSIWICSILAWLLLSLMRAVEQPDTLSLLLTAGSIALGQAMCRRLPGAYFGDADVVCVMVSLMFLRPAQVCCAVLCSCVIALLSSLGSARSALPYLPFYLCGACIASAL